MRLMIQQACQADLPAIAEIELKIEGEGAASIEVLQERIDMFAEGFLVAKKRGQLVGYAESCLWDEKIPSFKAERNFFTTRHRPDGHTLYLIFLGVDPDCQRQGVASMILAELLTVARQTKAERLHAVTWEHLISLYTAQGFTPIAEISDFMPGDPVTLLEYGIGG